MNTLSSLVSVHNSQWHRFALIHRLNLKPMMSTWQNILQTLFNYPWSPATQKKIKLHVP